MNFSALDHYTFPNLDVECTCKLCTQWRQARGVFDEAKMLTNDHTRSCMCWRCKKRRGLQQEFLAASSKRELFCELSYHASRHPAYGKHLMNWAMKEINQEQSNGWWATFGQSYPLSFWFARFQSAMSGLVSGASGLAA